MELIDRYVHEVGRHLPRKNRVDIQAELGSTLIDTLEAQVEGEASEEDVVALLKGFGSPREVAASYWPEGQYLIGPGLYPLFRMVVGIVLTIFIIVQLVLFGVALVSGQEFLSAIDLLAEMIGSLFTNFGIIVLVFAILQRFDVRHEIDQEEWDPRDLSVVEEVDTINRVGIVAEITISLVIVAILLFLPDKIGFVVSPGMEIILNPIIVSYIPLFTLSILLSIGVDVILLWRGRWEISTRLAKIGTNLFCIYVLSVLINSHSAWLSQQGVGGFFSFLEALPEGITMSSETPLIIGMRAFRLAFIIALIVVAVNTVKRIYQLVKRQINLPITIPLPVEKTKNNG